MRNMRRILFPILVVAIFFLIQQFGTPSTTIPDHATQQQPSLSVTSTNALVIRAVDGDTLVAKLDGSTDEVKIRLLGVNTPESVDPRRPVQCFGKEASKFAAATIEGRRARLEPDLQADEIDKYGRLLRNVILEDGTDFNAQLIKQGYAYAYLDFPMNKTRKVQLKNFQDEAERQQLGLWNPETCAGKK